MTNCEKFVEVFGPVPGFELTCVDKDSGNESEKFRFIAHYLRWWWAAYQEQDHGKGDA